MNEVIGGPKLLQALWQKREQYLCVRENIFSSRFCYERRQISLCQGCWMLSLLQIVQYQYVLRVPPALEQHRTIVYRSMEVSCNLDPGTRCMEVASFTLQPLYSLQKETVLPIRWETAWAPEPAWIDLWWRWEKSPILPWFEPSSSIPQFQKWLLGKS